MVSTPTGDAHAQVAANFAAALSRLGLKVALMAMSVDQDWYLEAFTPERRQHGAPRAARPGAQRHARRPAGATTLPVTEFAPNLVVVPPADEPMMHLPIDGLPALLQELSDGGVDVTVIAGPPLLEEADATIVAWATRNVLVGDHSRGGHAGRGARRRGPHGARRGHAVRRGDGRAADTRGLTGVRFDPPSARRPRDAARARAVDDRAANGADGNGARPGRGGRTRGRRRPARRSGSRTHRRRQRVRLRRRRPDADRPAAPRRGRPRRCTPFDGARGRRARHLDVRRAHFFPTPCSRACSFRSSVFSPTLAAAQWLVGASPRRAVARADSWCSRCSPRSSRRSSGTARS